MPPCSTRSPRSRGRSTRSTALPCGGLSRPTGRRRRSFSRGRKGSFEKNPARFRLEGPGVPAGDSTARAAPLEASFGQERQRVRAERAIRRHRHRDAAGGRRIEAEGTPLERGKPRPFLLLFRGKGGVERLGARFPEMKRVEAPFGAREPFGSTRLGSRALAERVEDARSADPPEPPAEDAKPALPVALLEVEREPLVEGTDATQRLPRHGHETAGKGGRRDRLLSLDGERVSDRAARVAPEEGV